jgi:peptide/nickel transport system ATP-binding protein
MSSSIRGHAVSEPLLAVRDLRVRFRTDRGLLTAVNGVSFDLAEREILCMVGESGSGKSMTMLAVMGLINDPNAVLDGSIRLRGKELLAASAGALRAVRGREIAMVFQDSMTALTPVYSIGWQIVEQLRAHQALSLGAARRRAVELLAEVGIARPEIQFDRFPHQLSGGMRQRAVIAMALSCRPAVLIADEPTTALDVTVQAQILALIRRLRDDFGSAVVLITHDLGVVAELADRVQVMYAGSIVERASAAELFIQPWHPYTRGLLDAIPPLDGARRPRLRTIAGAPPLLSEVTAGCAFAPRCEGVHAACIERPLLDGQVGRASACWLAPAGLPSAAAVRETPPAAAVP